ncbi:MAG: lamin tail domain-containing protein, partial [Acidobacteriota bacterium]
MKRTSIFAAQYLCVIAALIILFTSAPVSAMSESGIPVGSTTIVISQVYSGGGGASGTYINDYVELKNVSGSTQSLNGLSLQYASAVGNFGSGSTLIFALPNVSINPGQYFLVQTSPAGSGGVALPVTPDATTTNLSMSGTSGKVALANITASLGCGATATPCTFPNANIIDWVAYGAAGNGTAGNGEGGTSVNNGVAITATQGSVRKAGGCTDNNNNNADFDVVTAPVPRNTSSTLAPCGGPTVTQQHVVDYDGDGKTDFSVVR